MKSYIKPSIVIEEFAINDAVAACGDDGAVSLSYYCLRGSNNDTYNVFTESNESCATVPEYYVGVTSAVSSVKSVNLGNCKGAYAYCVRTDHSQLSKDQWVQSGTVLRHAQNERGNDTHGNKWHCMVAPAYGTIEEMKMS